MSFHPDEGPLLIATQCVARAQEVADSLFLSRRTVESYVNNIKFKLHCNKKSELIAHIQYLEQIGMVTF
jgi:DNA-binding CsgD family transcriptional regulator